MSVDQMGGGAGDDGQERLPTTGDLETLTMDVDAPLRVSRPTVLTSGNQERPATVESLPLELLERVLGLLGVRDFLPASTVSRFWKRGCQNLAKKYCATLMDEESLRDMLRLHVQDDDWIEALKSWYFGGIRLNRSPEKNSKFFVGRATISLPRVPRPRIMHAVGDRVITESKNNGISIWTGDAKSIPKNYFEGGKRIVQVHHLWREDKLFFLEEAGNLLWAWMHKKYLLPRANASVLVDGELDKFAIDYPWVVVRHSAVSGVLLVYKIDEEVGSIKASKVMKVDLPARVNNFNVWADKLICLMSNGVILNYRLTGPNAPEVVLTTEKITALEYGGLTTMHRSTVFISNLAASDLLDYWHMSRGQNFWIGSMMFGENLETINAAVRTTNTTNEEHVTYMIVRRRLLLCGTSHGRVLIYSYVIQDEDKSLKNIFVTDVYEMTQPHAVICLQKKPISRLDAGFIGKRVFLYVLFVGESRLEKIWLRAGMDWPSGDAVMGSI